MVFCKIIFSRNRLIINKTENLIRIQCDKSLRDSLRIIRKVERQSISYKYIRSLQLKNKSILDTILGRTKNIVKINHMTATYLFDILLPNENAFIPQFRDFNF
jgi:hypothetical protein